jgi:hypothetical protein
MSDAPDLAEGSLPDSRPATVPTRAHGGIASRFVDGLLVVAAAGSVLLSAASYLRGRDASPSSAGGSVERLESQLRGRTLKPTPVLSALEGSIRSYDHGPGPALLLFFRSTCPACERNASQWEALTRSLAPGIRKVAFAVEEPGSAVDWTRRHRLTLDDILILRRPEDWAIPAVPATLLVDKDGKVREVKIGVLDSTALGILSKRVQR